MKKPVFLPLTLAALLLVGAGCGRAAATAENGNVNTPETAATSTAEQMAVTSTPAETNTNIAVNAPAKPPAPKPAPTNGGTAVKKTFYVELDDSGSYPKSGTAAKGSIVTVTFKVRPTNVFYNGLIVKSNTLNLGKIEAGQSRTASFTATEDETFVAEWITGTVKARWTLIVK